MSAAKVPGSSSLAEEAREPVLEFRVLKSWDYRRRMRWTLGLVVLGLLLQVGFLSPWPGVPFLLVAIALSWVVGFDTARDRRSLHLDQEWETVPYEKLRDIIKLDRAMKDWDSSVLDITAGAGGAFFVLSGVAFAAAAFALIVAGHQEIGLIVAVDGGLLVLPQFFSGMRRIHRQPDLLVKAKHVDATLHLVRERLERRGELSGQLLMSGPEDARQPTDLRLSVRFPDAPNGFHGIQCQVVLNRVQGKPHPYFYSVVVAAEGMGLLDAAKGVEIPEGLVRETKSEKDVDVVVIRQYTTKTSGYHTKPVIGARTAEAALAVAESFLDSRPSTTPS